MYLWWNILCGRIKQNLCFICFWRLYGQHSIQRGQLMTTFEKRLNMGTLIGPTYYIIGTALDILFFLCWANVARPYEQNYVVPMLVFKIVSTSSLMLAQRWANILNYYIIDTITICWIYFFSNVGPTSPLWLVWAELHCSNIGFQHIANTLIDVEPTYACLLGYMISLW